MPMQLLQEISQATDSRTDSRRSLLIRQWIVTYADTYRNRDGMPRDVSDGRQAKIFETALRDIPTEQLAVAFDRVLQVCKFFPTPADIRAQLDQANAGGFELKAEEKWQQLLEWVRAFYHPDLGVKRGAPQLDPVVAHAARAAGGFHWIECCPEATLWALKKNFIESFTRVHETGAVEHLLSDGEAKRILANLRTVLPEPIRTELAPAHEPSPTHPSKSEIRAVLDCVLSSAAPTAATMSNEEFERRKSEQKRRLEEWVAARPQSIQTEARS